MMRRRDLFFAGFAVAAAAAAEALRPRGKLVLLGKGTLADAVPTAFGAWTAEGSSGLVSPEQAGRLAKTLYSEIVQRIYTDTGTGQSVMLLAAYGDTQSDLLQLHRPESCYPAVGFNIASTKPSEIPVARGVSVPGRKVVALAEDRRENISYWTRMGERLPQSAKEQRSVRLENAMHGFVADGILVRFSVLGDSDEAFRVLDNFIPEFLASIARDKRPALIGTRLTKMMG